MVIERFITIEGGEGVGKSVFTAGLSRALADRGVAFELGREPGGTPSAERIRAFWAKSPEDEPWLAMTELCLVSAARAQHVGARVRPALAAGRWYLCDRYADSSRVYQGTLGGLAPRDVEAVIQASTGGLEPDLTFLLDCDVATAQARIAKDRGDATAVERYDREGLAFHERLRQAYLELARAHPSRIVTLDASQPTARSVEAAVRAIEERFLGKP
jgi:dTMP kinase